MAIGMWELCKSVFPYTQHMNSNNVPNGMSMEINKLGIKKILTAYYYLIKIQ